MKVELVVIPEAPRGLQLTLAIVSGELLPTGLSLQIFKSDEPLLKVDRDAIVREEFSSLFAIVKYSDQEPYSVRSLLAASPKLTVLWRLASEVIIFPTVMTLPFQAAVLGFLAIVRQAAPKLYQ